MGFTFGIAGIAGCYATTTGAWAALLLLALPLLILALTFDATVRRVGLWTIAGLIIGGVVGLVSAEPDVPPIQTFPDHFLVTIVGDPEVGGRGRMVRGQWNDDQGYTRESYFFLPASARVERGDKVLAAGRVPDGSNGSIVFVDQVRLEQRAGWIDRLRSQIRANLDLRLQAVVPGSPGSLALGLIDGDDSGLTDDEQDALRTAGLSHITAVSGWNVTVVIATLAFVLAACRVRGWLALSVVVPVIALYAWIVGFDPPIVRAAVMGSLALVGVAWGRPVHLLTPLSLTGAVMVLWSPEILHSLSFQLSFLSMLGISVVGHVVRSIESRLLAALAAAALTPVGAAIVTAPLIAETFGYLSLYTIPANIVVAPFIPIMTYLSGLAALLASVPIVGMVIGACVWILGKLVLDIAIFCSSLPMSRVPLGPIDHGALVGTYGLLLLIMGMTLPEGRYLYHRLAARFQRRPQDVVLATAGAAVVMLVGNILPI